VSEQLLGESILSKGLNIFQTINPASKCAQKIKGTRLDNPQV
jgi:hypothetical protein